MTTAVNGFGFSNISSSTAAFKLKGGAYGTIATATFGGGIVKLQRLALDGSTYVSMAAATDFSAAGGTVDNLPPGIYSLLRRRPPFAPKCRGVPS